MSSSPPRYYYSNESKFDSLDEYERHVVTDTQIFQVIQAMADVELYKLKKQGMSWEHEVKSDWNENNFWVPVSLIFFTL
jgi:hypothetical protein